MAQEHAFPRGHSLLGDVVSTVFTSWGKAGEEAVTIQFAIQNVELHGSDSKAAYDVGITRADLDVVATGISGRLEHIHKFLGLAAADLDNAVPLVPASETGGPVKLNINVETLGEEIRHFRSIGAGADQSVRTLDVPKARPFGFGPLNQNKTSWMNGQVTLRALNPGNGVVATLEDGYPAS